MTVRHSWFHKQAPRRDPLPEDVQDKSSPCLGQQDDRTPFLRGAPRKNKTHASRVYRDHQSNEACSSRATLTLHDMMRRADGLVRLTPGFVPPTDPASLHLQG